MLRSIAGMVDETTADASAFQRFKVRSMPEMTLMPTLARLDTGNALAREADLLQRGAENASVRYLWFWEGTRALVAPRKLAVKPGFAKARDMMAEAGWPVHVRATGGDVTPQGPGIFNVTHVYTRPRGAAVSVSDEYDLLCGPIERALGPGATRGWQPGAFCDGAHNVQFDGKKFAGTAMRFKPNFTDKSRATVLAHAILLADPPEEGAIAAINRFLSALGEPRVISLGAHTGLPDHLPRSDFMRRLADEFGQLVPSSEELILL